MNDWLKVGDVAYFKDWWGHKDVFATVIEVDGKFFRLKFGDANLEIVNQEDGEWFKPRHIDAVYRWAFDV